MKAVKIADAVTPLAITDKGNSLKIPVLAGLVEIDKKELVDADLLVLWQVGSEGMENIWFNLSSEAEVLRVIDSKGEEVPEEVYARLPKKNMVGPLHVVLKTTEDFFLLWQGEDVTDNGTKEYLTKFYSSEGEWGSKP